MSTALRRLMSRLRRLGGGPIITPPPPPPTQAPIFSVTPVITGTAAVGQILTATTGSATGNPAPNYALQWRRDGTSIAGAIGSTYQVQAEDQGTSLTVASVAANGVGTPAVAVSAALAIPAAPPVDPPVTTAPALTTLNPAVSAPVFATEPTYPIELDFEPLDETAVQDQDWLRVIASLSRDLSSPLFTFDIKLTAAVIAAEEFGIPGLAAISSPAQTYFGAFIIKADGTYSSTAIRKHGDTTAPVITTTTAATYAENAPIAHVASTNEFVTWALGGTDAALLELSAASGTSTTVRLAGNASANYDLGGKQSYSFDLIATDDAQLSKTEPITWTITNVTSDDPVSGFAWATDGANKNAGVTVSGATATIASGSGPRGVRAATALPATGKYYFEYIPNATTAGGDLSTSGFGIAQSAASMSSYLGGGTDARVALNQFGNTTDFYNNVKGQSVDAVAGGVRLGVAIDMDNKKYWLRINSVGRWWDNNSSHDPATNLGGVSFSALTGSLFLAYFSDVTGHSVQIFTGNGVTTGTLPSGFNQLP